MDCNCPNQSTLTSIVAENCGVDLKQIQRIAFQRKGTAFDSAGTPATDISLLSTWQTLTSATDGTKIVISPLIGGDPTIESGDAITVGGGDNSTLNGVSEVEGVSPSSFTCFFKSLSAKVESAMKTLMCEKDLVVYLFLEGGRIAVTEITASSKYEGFEIQSLFVSDRGNQGFGTKDTVNLSFSLPSGYSDKLTILKPSFNPLTEL